MASPDEIVKDLLHKKGWAELFPAQQLAVDNGLLTTPSNYVIIAPTASGKTGVAEMAMLQSLQEGRRIAYLVPLQSLVNDKKYEFDYFSDEYSIFPNEDPKIDFNNADIVIMTFEYFYRNALLRPDIASTFGLVIVDEFHVLYDKLRGFNLEKVLTIIRLFKIRLICLSATFENKEMISEWLDASIIFIPNKFRAVELKHGTIDLKEIPNTKQIGALYRILEENDKYPTIIFCHRRIDTQSRAIKFCDLCTDDINPIEEINEKFYEILNRLNLTDDENSLISCMVKGVAFHHSGLRPEIRAYIEVSFREEKIKYLFATTGLAYGVNFPAKTVVLYDLDFWNREYGRQDKIPVHTYLQMAGRAGRPQFGNEGFAYVVAKDRDQLDKRIPEYLGGQIEEAISQIGHDDYFQKTILELVFAGKNKDEDIISFFNETYYNFLSERVTQRLVPFNLFETIKRHAEALYKNGFIVPEGAAGYRLTDLGGVTIDFLFRSFTQYELTPFVSLNRYLDLKGDVEHNFDLIYIMFKIFGEINTSRRYRKRSEIVDNFYRKRRIRNKKDIDHAEYSAYATYYGWMENLDEITIEDRFMVHAHPIASNARELRRLLNVYKSLAEIKHFSITQEFNSFCDRIYYGVTEEELPFVKIRGIGRDTTRVIKSYCDNVLKTVQNYKGTMLEVLCQLYQREGEEGFLNVHVPYISGVGPKRADLVLSLVKEELDVD